MKKIARQVTSSVSQPPTSGPSARAIAETPAHVPIALPRSAGGKALVMMHSVAGIISAAPRPWTARTATSQPSVGARPISALEETEDHDADQEDLAAAEDVAEAAAGDQQDGEGERVGVDRPLQRGQARRRSALDRRQRDVHDGVVEHHHEQREAHGRERPPAAVLLGDAETIGHWGAILSTMGRMSVVQAWRSLRVRSSAKRRASSTGARARRATTSLPWSVSVMSRDRRSSIGFSPGHVILLDTARRSPGSPRGATDRAAGDLLDSSARARPRAGTASSPD